jgi:hypothetical protein
LIRDAAARLLAQAGFLRPFFAWRSRVHARRPTEWHLARRAREQWVPPEPGRRRSRFVPRLYDASGLPGYVRFTEHSVAIVEILGHLDRLEEPRLQWRVCAFSAGLLESLLASGAPEAGAAHLPAWAADIAYLDWLEAVQEAAHDNSGPHTGFLLDGFRSVEAKLRAGRSVALQRDEVALNWRFLGLSREETDRRIAEHRDLRDLDPAAVAREMAPAREEGLAAGRSGGSA